MPTRVIPLKRQLKREGYVCKYLRDRIHRPRPVILSEAKNLRVAHQRFFASLRMTIFLHPYIREYKPGVLEILRFAQNDNVPSVDA